MFQTLSRGASIIIDADTEKTPSEDKGGKFELVDMLDFAVVSICCSDSEFTP